MKNALNVCLIICTLVFTGAANASDKDELTRMLDDFLAGATVGSAEAHDRFWAEDLVYSSSAGLRFGKSDIMEGFEEPEEPTEEGPVTTYSAEEVDVRLYGDTAVVAFKLVGTPEQGEVDYYFNTGTFLKRDDEWRVVAWQATRIPKEEGE